MKKKVCKIYVNKENQETLDVKKACRLLNVSRSGYYRFLSRKPSEHDIENEVLQEETKAIFQENKGRYGSGRVAEVLKKEKFMSVENV